MQVYVTLLSSDDYLKPILILNRNLKELNSIYQLYVMVMNFIKPETIAYLDKENINYEIMEPITYSEETIKNTPNERLCSIASKLNVFKLHQFSKVVYLDADCFFLQNIDDIFKYPDGSLIDDGNSNRGFCGMFTCIPSNHPLNYYISLLHHNYMWESDLIEELWFPYKSNKDYHIPFNYFVTVTCNFNIFYPIKQKVRGIHFCCAYKPWLYTDYKKYIADFNRRYMNINQEREDLIKYYFDHYLTPLKQDYPELFTE